MKRYNPLTALLLVLTLLAPPLLTACGKSVGETIDDATVSYTHLTLPTIYSV